LRAAHAVHPIAAVQSEYSLWTREPEDEMLDACRELGVTFVAYSPLGRAMLTGKLSSIEELSDDDFRRHNPRFQGEAFARNKRLADALAEIAAEMNATPAQVALAWLLSKHDHVVPIPGTRRKTHLQENVAAASIELDAQTIRRLDAVFAPDAVVGTRYAPEAMKGLNL
ncbi:MAG TPA: aldo/keto reductase, partial [Hyphomicrobiaceae bacterium]|nr:aldo/keto reductase [Hyphomicrobiaceae bacterium]